MGTSSAQGFSAVNIAGVNLLPTLLYPLYENHLRRVIKDKPQPRHVAVMCDGNRRWAREAGFADVSHGHRVGAKKIGELIRWCEDTKVEIVTVYLLSTENLKRSSEEVGLLFDIIADVVDELSATDLNCRIRLVGHMDLLPEKISTRMARGAEKTRDHTGVVVNIAVGYGGRQEIVDAVQALVHEEADKGTPADKIADEVTIESLSRHLYTRDQPDPDLVIRTSGEQRLSGFLLWQAAYSEIWFTDTYWPAFRRIDFLRALRDFSSRNRRFGK